jgi:hypothetical protein
MRKGKAGKEFSSHDPILDSLEVSSTGQLAEEMRISYLIIMLIFSHLR